MMIENKLISMKKIKIFAFAAMAFGICSTERVYGMQDEDNSNNPPLLIDLDDNSNNLSPERSAHLKKLINSTVKEMNENEEARNSMPVQLIFPEWTDDSSDSEDEK